MKLLHNIYYIFNAYIALVLFLFTKKQKDVWLIGGHNAKLYTDNSKVFYEYILLNHSSINIYWIVDKNASIMQDIKGERLIKGSIKSYLYFYYAKVVLFSDTLNSDIAPFSFVLPIVKHFYTHVLKIYLSHGTIALKKMPQYQGKIAKLKQAIFYSYDLAIASTELSKKAMLGYNINPTAIQLLGSARHDVLKSIPNAQRVILITPTWRSWLSSKNILKESDFFNQYKSLLLDINLHLFLRENNIHIHFYLHHMLHQYYSIFQDFENDVIKILAPSVNINNEIMSAELMITDYSSMCSDFYYLQKPIVFFQFDREKYIKKIGSEIDLENTIFGDVFDDSPSLVEHIITNMTKQISISKKQKEGERYFIHFKDKQNCSRIYNAITKKILSKKLK